LRSLTAIPGFAHAYHSKDIANVKVIKSRSNLKVKRSKFLIPIKALVIRNKRMKLIPLTIKNMANFQVFEK
jgi:hypothetical protein